ncbi:MAG: UTP--glucose-1-phosphate uridylyltransferase, partial [Phycisphaeraceae bacterium]|nr:UTP--glucose-1-phosphate uridylyltransferase [Phycisphaeraceae bacterium]
MGRPEGQNLPEQLIDADQKHLVACLSELEGEAAESFRKQLAGQDWLRLKQLIHSHVLNAPPVHLPERIEPVLAFPAEPAPDQADLYRRARARGRELIADGRVAAFTVAGGQGTRLGWDGPKGTYPATPVTGKPLFQLFAESLIKTAEKHDRPVPWYIMTSPLNDDDTRAFFAEHDHFGLDPANVMFFKQGTLPSFSLDGRALLADPEHLATNPDGHGGSLRALHTSGALADMAGRGVEQISYFQIDNPLVRCVDPLFLGLHDLEGAGMSSKMLPKAEPLEKVGNFVRADGRVSVIEYSDLPEELALARNEDGSLRFNAGNPAIHALSKSFVEKLNEGGFALPPHRAIKKVEHVD